MEIVDKFIVICLLVSDIDCIYSICAVKIVKL